MPKKQEDTANYKGTFMKQKKLSSLIALSISLELVMAPLPVIAADESANQNKKGFMDVAGQVINTGMGAYNNLMGNGMGGMPPQMNTDMAAFQQQQTPVPDKYFNKGFLFQLPGFDVYLATRGINPESLNCKTLPTTLHEANNEVCRIGMITNDTMYGAQGQMNEAFAYYNQYAQIEKQYKNYSAISNAGGQNYGLGCMQRAMEVLNGFFEYRTDELNTLQTKLEAMTAQFKEQSKMDLEAIEESTAVLGGENSPFAAKLKSKNPDLFDYGKRFDNPACTSMMAKDNINELGKSQGLLGIESKLKADFTAAPGDGSKYSPEAYLQAHNDVVADIKKMADKVAEQSKLNFSSIAGENPGGYSAFLQNVGNSVGSNTNVHTGLNPGFFSDLQIKFNQDKKRLVDEMNAVKSEIGTRGQEALSMLSNVDSDSSFNAELKTIENEMKGQCLAQAPIDDALNRIYDPNTSSFANKATSASIKGRIKEILSDVRMSPEKKLAELKAVQAQNSNRYLIKMSSSYEVQQINSDGSVSRKVVSPNHRVTPLSYFTDIINNCESQFQVNALNNKMSGKEALKKLRTLKNDYKTLSQNHARDIKNEIVKKMINCEGNGDANSSTVGSCSASNFEMTGQGFCANAAFSCSKNMQQCNMQAQKFVKDIKDERTARVKNYNQNIEVFRKQIVDLFDTTLNMYMQQSEILRTLLGAGFKSPTDIKRNLEEGEQNMASFANIPGDSLEIADPDKYLAMAKENVEKLKASVTDQQKQLLSGQLGSGSFGGLLGQHFNETKKNYKTVEGEAKGRAIACRDVHDKAVRDSAAAQAKQQEEQAKQTGELNDNKNKFCRQYRMVMNSPNPSCDSKVADLADAALAAVNTEEANRAAADLITACNSFNNEASDNYNVNDKIRFCRGKQDIFGCADLVTKSENHITCKDALKVKGLTEQAKEDKEKECDDLYDKVERLADNVSISSNNIAAADSGEEAHKSMKTNGLPSFCSSNNNSGPYNTKGNLPFGGGFQNPMLGQQGMGY